MCYIAIQFWVITINTDVNCYIALVLSSMSFVLCLVYLPESPRFLYSQRRFNEAREVVEKIAITNGVDMQGIRFKVEIGGAD